MTSDRIECERVSFAAPGVRLPKPADAPDPNDVSRYFQSIKHHIELCPVAGIFYIGARSADGTLPADGEIVCAPQSAATGGWVPMAGATGMGRMGPLHYAKRPMPVGALPPRKPSQVDTEPPTDTAGLDDMLKASPRKAHG